MAGLYHWTGTAGHVRIFDIRGKSIGQLSLVLPSDHPDPCPPVFTECLFWTNGIAALSSQAVVHVAEVTTNVYTVYLLEEVITTVSLFFLMTSIAEGILCRRDRFTEVPHLSAR
jgi:hypothetical protein